MLAIAGCGDGGLGACDQQADVSGNWQFQLTPVDADAGVATISAADSIVAQLEQVTPSGLSISRLVYGTLASDLFGTIEVPQLMHNDGSKTGSMLGCRIQLNVPIAMPVSDDNVDQGPLRLSLGGTVNAPHMMLGDPLRSTVILLDDQTMQPLSFNWTGTMQ